MTIASVKAATITLTTRFLIRTVLDAIGGRVDIVLGLGNGQLRGVRQYMAPAASATIAQDFDSDGSIDIATSSASGTFTMTTGNSDGSFRDSQTIATAFGASTMVDGDFNGDGKIDLAVTDDSANGDKNVITKIEAKKKS